ncbi:uncharacterized protein PGTG_01031 [Puccinia graminis f. sp. tritici CRL 75-36-700-3]|uniref:No apical meristem-associated C-terminal domain-containing protein n=1 Tax=Puccinia graminis f. sp. tritici (strain CRL 75-36-700-3 / race SCCL) TaxID=418459 RepID=E3JUH5_PUCGT|nr:uncharacterized protein PGTG_01031 [Puccinia graminis f. sp. tritici CRL 75-36-700-3]EFP75700.2 hypothetical protein PGTG_01031 [Puccinia graminis f. sp. tritici CRL 75-36-700-3]
MLATTKSTRTPNFTPNEDAILARFWIETSENVLVNNSQKSTDFWERITNSFHEHTGGSMRESKMLSNRWDLLQKATVKFAGYYNKIKNNPPSGTTEADHLKMAKRLTTMIPEKCSHTIPLGPSFETMKSGEMPAQTIMEKNAAKGEKQSAEFKRENTLQEETNTLSKIEVALKSDQMEKDLNTLTDDYAKEYFTKQKKAIITKMREKELKKSQSTS